jgi:hypothetical protein
MPYLPNLGGGVTEQSVSDAFSKLGAIAIRQNDAAAASAYFGHTIQVARCNGDSGDADAARVSLGVSAGNNAFDAHMRSLAQRVKEDTEKNVAEQRRQR